MRLLELVCVRTQHYIGPRNNHIERRRKRARSWFLTMSEEAIDASGIVEIHIEGNVLSCL